MTNIKSIAIAILVYTGINHTATAQNKIAYIDVSELMETMPEMKAANIQAEKLGKTYDMEYAKMVEEFETKAKKYNAEAANTTNAVKKTRNTELLGIRERIEQHKETAHKELQTKQEAIFTPIVEKAKKAIQKVGKAKGFNYVLDSTPGTDVVLAEGTNLLADVKKELGF